MDAGMMNLLISLVSGAVGGNVGGALAKAKSMGAVWNTILGAVGGAGGGWLATAVGGLATLGQAGNIGSSAVIGALLPLVVGMLNKKKAA